MTRNPNGAGGITLRKDGRYAVRVTDPSTGKRVVRYARTPGEAAKLLRAMTGRVDNGVVAVDASATLNRYAADWLKTRAGRRRSPSTVREYRRRLDHYILPVIGGVKVRTLTQLQVEDMLDILADRGLARSTVKAARNALAAMLTDAVRARHLAVNVATAARLPEHAKEAKVSQAPTPEQVHNLLTEAQGSPVEQLLYVLAGTGARIGEALGAQWADLDLDNGVWTVSRTVTRDLDGTPVLGARTKTGDTRRVMLSAPVVAAFREQRAQVAAARLKAGALWVDQDLVFPTCRGTVWDTNNARNELRPIAKAAGFPASFHSLRHAFATQAVAVLPSDAAVSKVLGHKRKATTTDLYGHLRDDDSAAVADAVASALGGFR